ncbi:MAG: choice-of-anchor D domain-containing protein [Kofleriaceae bacterium]|nr:choice-of-anchor D domain-containing protein [Kofleriaceae bacterium]
MKRRTRRLLAVTVVLVTTVLALAAPVPVPFSDVHSEPAVVVVQVPSGGSATGATTLNNYGDTPTMITALASSGDCTGVSASPTSFRLGSQGEGSGLNQHSLTATCGWTGFGIRRCQFNANDDVARHATFTVLCIAGNGTGGLTAMPDVLDFGSVVIGATPAQRTVRITNPSATSSLTGITLQIDEQAPGNTYSIQNCLNTPGCQQAAVVAPMGYIDVTVDCAPQAVGPIQKHLYVVAGDGEQVLGGVQLDCTGTGTSLGGITVTPPSLALSQQVNSLANGSLVVQNTSTTTVYSVDSTTVFGGASTQWTVTSSCPLPCALNPMTSLTLNAAFQPTAHGPQDATLSIVTSDPGAMTIDRDLDGTGLGATLELVTDLGTPPSFHVTTRPVGVTGDRAFQIRNGGNVELTGLTYTIAQPGTELAMVAPPQNVAPGATVDVRVACTPSAAQDFTATLEIRSSAAYLGGMRSVELRCTGTAGNLYSEPSAVDFGEVRIAPGKLVTQTITLRTGSTALPITADPGLTANPTGTLTVTAPTATTVSASEPYTTFDVVLDPSVDTPSLATTVSVSTSGNDTIEIPVLGKVVTPAVVFPEQLMIGSFCVGRTPATAEARLISTGTATIGLPARPYLAAMAASGFNLDPGSYPSSLQMNESATVRVRPLGRDTAGAITDTLVWSTDIEGAMSMPMTTMTAEFIANGGAITPQRVDFGRVMLREQALPTAIRIQNCGGTPLSLGVPTISPTGEFRNESNVPLPGSLEPNEIATVIVGFVPVRTGTRNGTLTISSSEGDLTVMLSGVGLGTDPGEQDTTSFYACDCRTSDPAAMWPVLVVVLVLRRRRRAGSG